MVLLACFPLSQYWTSAPVQLGDHCAAGASVSTNRCKTNIPVSCSQLRPLPDGRVLLIFLKYLTQSCYVPNSTWPFLWLLHVLCDKLFQARENMGRGGEEGKVEEIKSTNFSHIDMKGFKDARSKTTCFFLAYNLLNLPWKFLHFPLSILSCTANKRHCSLWESLICLWEA